MPDSDPTELVRTFDETALAKTVAASDSGQVPAFAESDVRDGARTLQDAAPPPSDPGPRTVSGPGRDTQLPKIGRYVLLRALGEGGMGVVYAAYDEELDRKVAVKIIHPSRQSDVALRTRIQREAQALARLSTPYVVTVYQVGEVDGQLYIAMEFVNGTTLSKWQVEPGRHWQDTLRMYLAAGQGLYAAHQAGLIHRGLQSANFSTENSAQAA
jgi:serine/threonine protein kinase